MLRMQVGVIKKKKERKTKKEKKRKTHIWPLDF